MNDALIIIFSLLSASTTYGLQKKKRVSAVRSSCLITLFFYCIVLLIFQVKNIDVNIILKAIFGASFVGMCSPRLVSLKRVLLITMLYLVLFFFALKKLPYDGGALGFLAFIAVSIIMLFDYSRSKFFNFKAEKK